MTKTVTFGTQQVPVPGFGAMGLSAFYGKFDNETSKDTLRKAIEIGCTFWNTADMYGCGANELLLGSVLAEGSNRSKVFLVTKFGNKWGSNGKPPYTIDGSPAYVKSAIDASIERLGTKPDAIALHRVDKNTPIEVSVKAMEEERQKGKFKYLGISECSAETLRKAAKVVKVDFIEIEYSPWTVVNEENGVLVAAKELDVVVLAYSPLGRGFLTGRYKSPEDFAMEDGDFRSMMPRMQKEVWAKNYEIVDELTKIAEKKGCTSGQLSLAWLMKQGNVIPIPGTKSEKYLIENFDSRNVELTKEEEAAIRAVIVAKKPVGDRYPAQAMPDLER